MLYNTFYLTWLTSLHYLVKPGYSNFLPITCIYYSLIAQIRCHSEQDILSSQLSCWRPLPDMLVLPRDAMHKRGYSRHAVSVCPSDTFVDHVKTNKHIFEIFSASDSHTILVFPYQTGWRYSDGIPLTGASNPGGYRQKSRFWSNSWLSKIAGRAKCQKHLPTTKLVYDNHNRPRTTGYRSIAGRASYELSDKNSYWRPCSVDRTVGDAPANVCLWRPAAWTNTPKRREQKRI